ncbi:MAG: bifunctional lysylphosphatidylglycerol synthetase/lysine--tRNA ligase LysX [Gordonia sp. (in: high G+C Gram-positive bacteria)]
MVVETPHDAPHIAAAGHNGTPRRREPSAADRQSADLLDHIRNPRGFGSRAPRIAGTITGVMATIALFSSVFPGFRHLIHVPRDYVDDYILSMPDTSFAWSFVLAMIAVALSARKRIAWWISVGYLLLFMSGNGLLLWQPVADELGVTESERLHIVIGLGVDLLVLIFLITAYRQFYTRVRRGAILRAAIVMVIGLAIATVIGWGLVWLFPDTLTRGESLPYAFNRVVAFAAIDQRTFDGHRTYALVNGLLGLFGALALIVAASVLFQSQRLKSLMTAADERLIRALIARFNDDDSLGYFSTRRDKAVVFSRDARAAITYRVELGVGLAGGDPIGDRDSWPDAIAEFLLLCERYGWHPAAMGVSERGAAAYDAAGFGSLNIGDEAILRTRDFSISGPAMKGVRQAITRTRRSGVTVRIRRHRDIGAAEMAQVIARADAWRDTDEERGFTMALSRIGDQADGECLLVEALRNEGTADETVIGMLSFVPWGRHGVSLDVMRRDRGGINGVVETMVSDLCRRSADLGIAKVSLNFATFRAVFEKGRDIGAGPVIRLSYSLLMFGSKFFQMESLYRSNAKYLPDWQPRFLCYEDSRMVARAGLAAIVTEGFVRLPHFGRKQHYIAGQSSIPPGIDVDALIATFDAEAAQRASFTARRPEQIRVRLDKLDRIVAAGVDPYPPADPPTHTIVAALAQPEGTEVSVAGRVTRLRDFGKVVFADIHDWSGEVQILLEESRLVAGTRDFAGDVDLGDLVDVRGVMGVSRSGQVSILADRWRMIGKCLRPLPDKWAGLTTPEARVRQRYLDLAISRRARDLLTTRSVVIRALREFLAQRGFLEVETPILQRIHGGANATPFATHIDAYHLDLYLRIAPELYLKRLCVGGVEKVFELGRNFRNEGVDFSHNPEFTSLEAYAAHGDYRTMRELAREMIQYAATAVYGKPVIWRHGDDGAPECIDISGDWPVASVYEVVSAGAGVEITPQTPVERLQDICERLQIGYRPDSDAGQIVGELYEHFGEARTEFPTFYEDFPISISPLTRAHRSVGGVAERWDLVAWGVEIGTAYTELTDPVEQRKRLTAQSMLAANGDLDAMELDEDFLQALEYAMPPTGGLGIGVDRVVMLITGQSIRDSLAFPLVKPHENATADSAIG